MAEQNQDPLREYRAKRDFARSPEPQGNGMRRGKKPVFVIQLHDAGTRHFDFRLEIDGVLKSWAVPKGPSTDPADSRLAVPTEDHPLDYADFEGVIPAGEYGGGTVLLWDAGTFRNLREQKQEPVDLPRSYAEGKIEVWLEGQRLRGGYALIRTEEGADGRWLLIKMKDDEADPARDPATEEDTSVRSGRTLAEIAAEEQEQA